MIFFFFSSWSWWSFGIVPDMMHSPVDIIISGKINMSIHFYIRHLWRLLSKMWSHIHWCFKCILWLLFSSHGSFSLHCRLICCWLWSHLHSQSQTCPRGIVTCTLPVYSRVIKNLACINIPISALSVVLQTTHWQPEKRKSRLCNCSGSRQPCAHRI